MKTKLILLALCLLCPSFLQAESGKHGNETPLSKQMEIIAKSFRQLGPQVADVSKRESALKLLQSIQKSAETARTLVPAKAKTVPAAEQAKFIASYQKEMDELLGQLSKLNEAVSAGKTEEAKKIMAGFKAIKTRGHEEFSSEE